MNDRNGACAQPQSPVEYEPPRVETLGSFLDLTAGCFYDKKMGDPDFWSFIPVTWCSS
jgi:hypothetical protein